MQEDLKFKVNLDFTRIDLKKTTTIQEELLAHSPLYVQLVGYEESHANSATGAKWQAVTVRSFPMLVEWAHISFQEQWQPQPRQLLATQSSHFAVPMAAQY